jgi:hypothetical protein
VLGAIILTVIIVFVLPSAILISGGLASAFLGHFLKEEAEVRHAGSELIDLNV